jgi:hypothetical protein
LDLAGETPLISRHLIAPLTVALVSLYAAHAGAQGAFPAPLPGQAAAPAGASPFPPVNGAPAATVAAPASPNAFSSGAAPVGGAGLGGGGAFGGAPPPQASGAPDACMKGFLPLRQETEKRGKLLEAGGKRKAGPDEICKLLTSYGAAESKMIKYVETNSAKCGIPPQVSDQMKAGNKNTVTMQQKVCGFAQQAAAQKAAATPSLSEVLGSSAAMPEAQTTRKGGSTFDTLNGNVLTR